MKVFLRLSSHAIYEDLVDYPPAGVKYLYKAKAQGKAGKGGLAKLWKYYTQFRPPAIQVNDMGSGLIHSNAGVMILNKKPWVMDIEDVGSLSNFDYRKLDSFSYRKSILSILNSGWCRKIMPYTLAARRSICQKFPELEKKMEVVYPAIHTAKFRKEKHDGTRLLFISTRFHEKGGPQILEAFQRLERSYDVHLTMVTNAPQEFVEKYKSRNIEFMKPNLSREELFRRFYPGSDIFLFLTHFDTFGFVMLEAMNFSLPVIALREYSTPEVVEDGKNGFLIDCRYVRDNFPQYSTIEERAGFLKAKPQEDVTKALVEKCSFLIENEKAMKRMGEAGRRMVSEGKFSIIQRNRKLKKIYEGALKSP